MEVSCCVEVSEVSCWSVVVLRSVLVLNIVVYVQVVRSVVVLCMCRSWRSVVVLCMCRS